jgi:hypothetical protein
MNYQDFKNAILQALNELKTEGREIIPKKWAKIDPYIKKRYKPEFWEPVVWLYRKDSRLGAHITGEDVQQLKDKEGLKRYILNVFFL